MRPAPFVPFVCAVLLTVALPITAQTPVASNALIQPLAIKVPPKPSGITWKQRHGEMYFNTNIGSFRVSGSDANPAEGTLDMTFKGTVLIAVLDPASTLTISGNVRKELTDTKDKRVVYFGEGRITLAGRFHAIQFFGSNLRAYYDGFGVLQLIGEFDKNLDTGQWWYAGDSRKEYWQTSMTTVPLPKPTSIKPRIKMEGGN